MEKRNVRLREVFDDVLDADVLLFRDRGLVGRVIAAFGRSRYTHVEMLSRWDSQGADVGTDAGYDLMSTGFTKFGGRTTLLASQVHRYPGRIDVYRHEGLSMQLRAAIARTMRRQAGVSYHFAQILRLWLLHTMPLLRDGSDEEITADRRGRGGRSGENWLPKICSEAVSYAYQNPYGRPHPDGYPAIDLVPQLADAFTEPGDEARSALLKYQYTLLP